MLYGWLCIVGFRIKLNSKGPPQLKKSLKFQLLVIIFETPASKKWPNNKKVVALYLIVILKIIFFQNYNPSPISSESRTSSMLSIEVASKYQQYLSYTLDEL